ncbi:DEAD/DEAH box helicase [Novosphingobium bradum]|uniref:DEAD/DEAH box helicase n=1 Tax=Novosphingobium bradum TaxID=1737444 RepID=A0ABV7IXS6_9SPHN
MAEPRTVFRAVGNRVQLHRETPARLPFGKAAQEVVPVEDWITARAEGSGAALARMWEALGDGSTARDGAPLVQAAADAVELHPDFVARLTDSEAQSLGLPLATQLALNLRSQGLIHRDGFRIDTHWTRTGGVVVRADARNGRLHHNGKEWRIPEAIHSALSCVDAVNAASNEAARQAALAALKATIGDEAGSHIRPDGVIERLRLAYASGLSLSLRASAEGFDFDPVLFSRERLCASDDGSILDEEADSLLPPALAEGFVRRFRAGDGTRRAYLLGDGSLLFIDPQLSRVLGTVRRAQAGTPEQRRAFAAAPERHIAEALREAGEDPADCSQLFVETQQFSERVAGIDVWRKPVLPWIKPKPNSWLPEAFGIRIGEPPEARTLEIPPERLAEATDSARLAVREERATFRFDGEDFPATQSAITALEQLGELVEHARLAPAEPGNVAPEGIRERYFLQVRDNLEDVAFAPLGPAAPAGDEPPPELPATLRSPPKPHQVDGFHWLVSCWRAGLPGALLADDMGLGKTYQALALLAWLRAQEPHPRPVLIVAPSGLLANWRAEIARHLEPDALGRVVSAYGTELSRLRQGSGRYIDSGASAIDPAAWSQAGLVLTTYETMRDYHLSFARQPFAAILYDEAQKLKNPASQLTRAAKTLNARFQLAMTGTPVENRLQDLWSIYDVVHPGLLGSSKAFEQNWPAQTEKLKSLHDFLTRPGEGRPPVLLRRLKDECLDSLPAKRIVAMPVPMPAAQARAYENVIARALAVKGTGERGRMLEVLHLLRGVSLHPRRPDDDGGDDGYFRDSARLAALFDILRRVADAGEKALVFCESLAMQALLAAELRRHFALGHPVLRIHGGITGDARQAAVETFQSRPAGFDVMILSPKAGGVGLTLTAANHVIHLSRWWNPAVEDQATDRAYRIGQTRDVTVYLPQSVHPDPAIGPTSFDIKLHELMERKRALGRGLLAPGDDEGDTDTLFDLVVSEVPERDPPAPAPAPTPPVAPTETPVPSLRGRLTLRRRETPRPAATPIDSPPVPSPWPRRLVYEEGGLRDRAIFTGPIATDPIRELVLVDPYAGAGERARRHTADFARMLLGDGTGVEPVTLVTFDADSVDVRDPESSEHQHAHMHECWKRAFGNGVGLQYIQLSRRGNRALHDREVRATTRSGRRLIWDLGHGIEGVMTARFRCVVVLTEE